MKYLIDANLFAKKAFDVAYPVVHGWNDHERGLTLSGIAQLLDEMQPVDAVPVIRCRECKHSVDYYNDGECYCRNPEYSDMIYISGGWNHYCGYSERREK